MGKYYGRKLLGKRKYNIFENFLAELGGGLFKTPWNPPLEKLVRLTPRAGEPVTEQEPVGAGCFWLLGTGAA